MRPGLLLQTEWRVLAVCLSVMIMSPTKTAEPGLAGPLSLLPSLIQEENLWE